MSRRSPLARHASTRAAALLVAALAAGSAMAASGVTAGAQAIGTFLDSDGFQTNQNVDGNGSVVPGVTASARTGCVARVEGGVGCSYEPPLPTDYWYQNAGYPVMAAADAVTTFGTNHVRVWSHGNHSVVTSEGGATSYVGLAGSAWTEEISYSGAPGLVTFVMRLTASWNDFGRFSAYGGVMVYGGEQPLLDGRVYFNCAAGTAGCVNGTEPGSSLEHIVLQGDTPDNTSGSVDMFVSFSHYFSPRPFDPEDPNWTPYPLRDFVVGLQAEASGTEGAEVDAFHTMSLQQIVIPAGATVGFGSGTVYNIAVVPEPGAVALWLAGLAVVGRMARRRRSG